MKTVAIIQARLGSHRLADKVLLDIAGQTMIERVVNRVKQCKSIDEIVIATTTSSRDQRLVEFCRDKDWNCFAGSENDVLNRYVETARQFNADNIVRITGDCPLIDPMLVDEVNSLVKGACGIQYSCNFFPNRRFPRGLDCESLTMKTLLTLDQLAEDTAHREHVTLYAYQNNHKFTIASIDSSDDYSSFRWTVDTAEDLSLIRSIYEYFEDAPFSWRDVLEAYSRFPEWREINKGIQQKPTNVPQPHFRLLVQGAKK